MDPLSPLDAADAPVKPAPTAQVPSGKRFLIKGRVVSVSQICGGGAAITREMEEQLPPPRPLPGRKLLVVAGERIAPGPLAGRITADPNGRFAINLPTGAWCFFDAGRTVVETAPDAPAVVSAPDIDAECMAEERRRCDQIVRVGEKSVVDVEVGFYQPCSESWNQPCYRGPLPP